MGIGGAKRAGQRSRTVYEDWLAWLPQEMDQLFASTRNDLECSNLILSIALDEALGLCEQERYRLARERAVAFLELFDRLANQLGAVVRSLKNHGSHFGVLPSVKALSPSNYRGATAQKLSTVSNLLAKVVFRSRTRFFHKLHVIEEIIDGTQKQARAIVESVSQDDMVLPENGWKELEVLSYDLNTCMGETIVVLKSYFCALPPEELDSFRQALAQQARTETATKWAPTTPLREK